MAYTYFTGVVEPGGNHFTTGPSSATQTNINELVSKAVRRIWRSADFQYQGSRGIPYGAAADHAQMLVNNNKFVIPTLFDGAGANSEFKALTLPTFLTRCQQFSTAMKGPCSVVEIVNEVHDTEHRAPPGPGGGKYWQWFREAADIFHADGFEVLLSGVPNRPSFLVDADAEDIWSYCDGVGIHSYFLTPGTALTSSGTMLYYLNNRRRQLDGLAGLDGTPAIGGDAVGLPIWLTEFGWVTKKPNPAGPGFNLWVASESGMTSRIVQAYTNFATHAEYLKLRAATLFTWPDWSMPTNNSTLLSPFRYSGIRTNEVPPYNAPAGTDQLVGVQVAQDSDTLKPTHDGTIDVPVLNPGDALGEGTLTEVPGRWIRYAQGIPVTAPLPSGSGHYANDALYFADIIAAGRLHSPALGSGVTPLVPVIRGGPPGPLPNGAI